MTISSTHPWTSSHATEDVHVYHDEASLLLQTQGKGLASSAKSVAEEGKAALADVHDQGKKALADQAAQMGISEENQAKLRSGDMKGAAADMLHGHLSAKMGISKDDSAKMMDAFKKGDHKTAAKGVAKAMVAGQAVSKLTAAMGIEADSALGEAAAKTAQLAADIADGTVDLTKVMPTELVIGILGPLLARCDDHIKNHNSPGCFLARMKRSPGVMLAFAIFVDAFQNMSALLKFLGPVGASLAQAKNLMSAPAAGGLLMGLFDSPISATSTMMKNMVPGLEIVPAGSIVWLCKYGGVNVDAMASMCTTMFQVPPEPPGTTPLTVDEVGRTESPGTTRPLTVDVEVGRTEPPGTTPLTVDDR